MNHPILGIQLYTLRDFCRNPADFDVTLGRLEALGVKDVQISAVGDFPAAVQREICDRHGMAVCVTHKNLDQIESRLDALIEDHKVLGCDALGLGWCPEERRDTLEHTREFAREVDELGRKLAKHGMAFHYHNHDFEFAPLPDGDGRSFYDVLLEETDPANVKLIPDVMWMHYAGQDPAAWLYRLKGRVKVLHFKDYVLTGETVDNKPGKRFVSLGQGVTGLDAVYRAACETDVPFIVYEQDGDWTNGDPFVSTEESWKYMNSLTY